MFNEFHDEVSREELYGIYGEHNQLSDDELDDLHEEMYDDSMDGDHASGLASAGWGTDEDYHYDSWQDESDLWNEC
jgi:hypothetical protein